MMKHFFLFVFFTAMTAGLFAQEDSIVFRSIDEVVVTGARVQTNRNNIPMTISVVGRSEIEESGESALLSALNGRIPSLFITQRGVTGFGVSTGGTGGITLRGVGGSPTTGVLILIDGHPQYMGIMGHHLPDAYTASDVEKVEVIRGPASLLYGSNAMGGAINLITRRQDVNGWSANGHIMYGSYNTQKYQASAGLKKGKFDGYLSLNHDRTDGHRPNSPFSILNGYAKAGYGISDHFRVWADASLASFEAQNPGTTARPMIDNIADILRGVASVSLENKYDKTEGAFKFFYNFGEHKINDGYAEGGTPRVDRFRSNDYNYGITWYQIFRPFQGNTITAGIDYKNFGGLAKSIYQNNTPENVMVDTASHETAGYLIVQQTLFDRLTLNAGMRLENSANYGNEWIPQGGIAYRPFRYTVLKASVAKGFRSPTIRELFMWNHNPDLKPERMMNYELSVGQSFFDNRLYAELTGFIAKGSNIIQTQAGALLNTGSFENSGVELAVRWEVLKNLLLQGNYSYLNVKKPILNAPEQQAFLSASYRLNKWSFSASYQYVHRLNTVLQAVDAGTGAVTAPEQIQSFGLIDAKASYRPLKWLTLFVKGENLADKHYEAVYQYPMPGITVFGGLSVSLNGCK
jgi:iron complex outermembrane receptor protein